MAWTIDTNFGSTLTATTAFAPFDTAGGNRVINFGAGIVYRDDFTITDMQIECDLVVKNQIQIAGFTYDPFAFLIGRRQTSDGSFYAVGYTQVTSGLGGRRGQMNLFKYNGTSDVFTTLAESLILATDLDAPVELELLKYRLKVNGSSIQGSLLNSSGVVLLQVSDVDTEFSSAGNPGIGGALVIPFGQSRFQPTISADNLQIDSI